MTIFSEEERQRLLARIDRSLRGKGLLKDVEEEEPAALPDNCVDLAAWRKKRMRVRK